MVQTRSVPTLILLLTSTIILFSSITYADNMTIRQTSVAGNSTHRIIQSQPSIGYVQGNPTQAYLGALNYTQTPYNTTITIITPVASGGGATTITSNATTLLQKISEAGFKKTTTYILAGILGIAFLALLWKRTKKKIIKKHEQQKQTQTQK